MANDRVEIKLTLGLTTLVDAEDFAWLSAFRWRASHSGHSKFYAVRSARIDGVERNLYMHRVIVNAPPNLDVDHINGNSLDNRRCNLRVCTHAENLRNAHWRHGTSRFKGVSWHAGAKAWEAYIRLNGRKQYLGSFESEIDAAKPHDAVALMHFAEFARLNFPDNSPQA
jgi:hypothetical protein